MIPLSQLRFSYKVLTKTSPLKWISLQQPSSSKRQWPFVITLLIEVGKPEEEKKEGRAERDSARNVRSWITDQRADCVLTEHPSAGFLSPSPHGKMQWKPLITVGMERIRKRSLCRLWALLPIYTHTHTHTHTHRMQTSREGGGCLHLHHLQI